MVVFVKNIYEYGLCLLLLCGPGRGMGHHLREGWCLLTSYTKKLL